MRKIMEKAKAMLGRAIFFVLSLLAGARYDYEKFAVQATEAFLGPVNGDTNSEG